MVFVAAVLRFIGLVLSAAITNRFTGLSNVPIRQPVLRQSAARAGRWPGWLRAGRIRPACADALVRSRRISVMMAYGGDLPDVSTAARYGGAAGLTG